MGRWTQYDEDEYRLPEGMKRIGYDSDTGKYQYRDADGSVWEGAEGAEYGELTKVSGPSHSSPNHEDDDVEATPRVRAGGYELLTDDSGRSMAHSRFSNISSYRSLFPFFLIIAVVLLLIWRLVLGPNLFTGNKRCPEGTVIYYVQTGDSCWDVARSHGIDLKKLTTLNPKLRCDPLIPGASMCVPPQEASFAFKRNAKRK
ncbi:hypothetical protein FA15DRAFT_669719 [Coprinopsis marcescibilis]|uniref:LysM domain-containing protein n=1 Tax=Coprinopsis marcescibilis TaxID=230819 RepID=A0A5C3KUG1_COPMA|nr:hypothetical protein FA15DRAFT_669719 [Coprinopsis marcescibilis]